MEQSGRQHSLKNNFLKETSSSPTWEVKNLLFSSSAEYFYFLQKSNWSVFFQQEEVQESIFI